MGYEPHFLATLGSWVVWMGSKTSCGYHPLPDQEDRKGIKLEIIRLITMRANEPHIEVGVDPPA